MPETLNSCMHNVWCDLSCHVTFRPSITTFHDGTKVSQLFAPKQIDVVINFEPDQNIWR